MTVYLVKKLNPVESPVSTKLVRIEILGQLGTTTSNKNCVQDNLKQHSLINLTFGFASKAGITHGISGRGQTNNSLADYT